MLPRVGHRTISSVIGLGAGVALAWSVGCFASIDEGLLDRRDASDRDVADTVAPQCPSGMIAIRASSSYCIDAREVTNGEYAAFLAASAVVADPVGCEWKRGDHVPSSWAQRGADDLPVRGVDWCDAVAYCTSAKKNLCGRIGGGPVPFSEFRNPSVSAWFNACSAGGTRTYPYGDVYDPRRASEPTTTRRPASIPRTIAHPSARPRVAVHRPHPSSET
jgi:hypothetical protein